MGRGMDLYAMGYRNLVPVIPPDAALSENSKVPPAMRGKAPGRRNQQGKWAGFPQWQSFRATAEQVAKFESEGANIGMIASGFPALDIDSMDEDVARQIMILAIQYLGLAPVRYGRRPKRLLVYRSDEDFPETRLKIEVAGRWHLVEMLAGAKRQYLLAGRHPSGVEYTWEGKPLWEIPPEELTLITSAHVRAFFQAVVAHYEAVGCTTKLLGGAAADQAPPPVQTELLAPALDVLRACVQSIPNDEEHSPDREHYLNMAYAIKASAGPEHEFEGRDIFFEWAGKRIPDDRVTGNPETWEMDWKRCHPPFRLGWEWLLSQSPQAASMEFPAVAEAPPAPHHALPTDMDEKDVLDRVVLAIRSTLRYTNSGIWFFWNGARWVRQNDTAALAVVIHECGEFAKRLRGQADVTPTKAEAAPFLRLAQRVTSLRFMMTVQTVLKSQLLVEIDAFDADPWLLNTPAGVVDLRLGLLREATPEDMCARMTAVAPEAGPAPLWERFLQETTGGDEDLVRYLQKYMGYTITGHTSEQTLLFVWGPGGNGKSVFVNAIMHAIGEYGGVAPMDAFASTRGDAHPTALAGLVGCRLVTAQETQVGRKWDEARIKAVTSGEPLAARFMRQDFFTFTPTFGLVLVGNHAPEIRALDDAMRRRLNIVPFTRKPAVVDLFLGDKLKGEASRILQWLIDGCLLWQREGLRTPTTVQMQTREYFEEEDPLQQWIDDACVLGSEHTTTASVLYRSWCQWCNGAGEDHGSQKQFSRRLGAKLSSKSKTVRLEDGVAHRGFQGIGIRNALDLSGVL